MQGTQRRCTGGLGRGGLVPPALAGILLLPLGARVARAQDAVTERELCAAADEARVELERLGFLFDGDFPCLEVVSHEDLRTVETKLLEERESPLIRERRKLRALFARGLAGEIGSEENLRSLWDPAGEFLHGLRAVEWRADVSLGSAWGRIAVAHELAHAWQDARGAFAQSDLTTDQELVRITLCEGEADLIASAAFLASRGEDLLDSGIEGPFDLPRGIREGHVDRYAIGEADAYAAYLQGGWDAVERLRAAPPPCTALLLHPERSGLGAPSEVAPIGLTGPDVERVCTDVLGELSLVGLLAWSPAGNDAVRAAIGWDGDRAASYLVGGRSLGALRVVFDREEDAEQFAHAVSVCEGWGDKKDASRMFLAGRRVDWFVGPADLLEGLAQLGYDPKEGVPSAKESDGARTTALEEERLPDLTPFEAGGRRYFPQAGLSLPSRACHGSCKCSFSVRFSRSEYPFLDPEEWIAVGAETPGLWKEVRVAGGPARIGMDDSDPHRAVCLFLPRDGGVIRIAHSCFCASCDALEQILSELRFEDPPEWTSLEPGDSEDEGLRVTQLSTGTEALLTSVAFLDRDRGFAVGGRGEQDPAVLLSTADGGHTWTRVETGVSARLYDVVFRTEERGFACGLGGTILATQDGGRTWTHTAPLGEGFLAGLSFVDDDTGFVVGGNGPRPILGRTRDGGRTWQSLAEELPEGTQDLRAVLFPDRATGFAAGSGGTLLVTSDGGASWTRRATGTDVWLKALAFVFGDRSQGWCGGSEGTLLATSDGGDHWKRIPFPSKEKINAVALPDGSHGLAGTMEGSLWWTADAGSSWRLLYRSPHAIAGLRRTPDGAVLAACEGGVVLRVEP